MKLKINQIEITKQKFVLGFYMADREEFFTDEGLGELYDNLTKIESDTGLEFNCDPKVIAMNYTELEWDKAKEEVGHVFESAWYDSLTGEDQEWWLANYIRDKSPLVISLPDTILFKRWEE